MTVFQDTTNPEPPEAEKPTSRVAAQPVQIRSQFFSPGGLLFPPRQVIPVLTGGGWAALVNRAVVRNWVKFRNAAEITDDEQWLLAARRWGPLAQHLQLHAPTAQARFPGLSWSALCALGGYVFENQPKWRYCRLPVCPHCLARRTTHQFQELLRCFVRRPPGSPVWGGFLRGIVSTRTAMTQEIQTRRVAGAVGFVYPVRLADDTIAWAQQAVLLTDERKRLHGLARIRRFHGVGRLALAASQWLGYPRRWTQFPTPRSLLETLKLLAQFPAQTKLTFAYGACKLDWEKGKGLLDWKGYEPTG